MEKKQQIFYQISLRTQASPDSPMLQTAKVLWEGCGRATKSVE
jgi:hypothetical protein